MCNPYLLDSNVFIQSKNSCYAFDIAPTFWIKLNSLAEDGVFSIIDRVKNELTHPAEDTDEVKLWIENEFSGNVLSTATDPSVFQKYTEITQRILNNHQNNPHYKQSAVDRFMEYENADAWLIACAVTYGNKIVTFEKYEPKIKKEIKIPNVCIEHNVEYDEKLTKETRKY
jgi:hypothetical protein